MSAPATVIRMPGVTALPSFVPKKDRDVMDTVLIHPEKLDQWKRPGRIQRPLKANSDNVVALAREMQLEAARDPEEAYCEIPGVITLAKLDGDTYLLDGQHRLDGGFRMACGQVIVHGGVSVKCALARIRVITVESWTEMADEFVRVNGQLVRTKPEDALRAASMGNVQLQKIEKECPWIGYDRTGESKRTILLSMATAARTWFGSGGVVPAAGPVVADLTKFLTTEQCDLIVDFFKATAEAGWVNPSFARLWGALNLSINMWIWRRVVLGQFQTRFHGGIKPMVLTRDQFVGCMRTLPLNADYHAWLSGRTLRDRDRVPCYSRLQDAYRPAIKQLGIEARFPMATDWGA